MADPALNQGARKPFAIAVAFLILGLIFFMRSYNAYFVADDYVFAGTINLSNSTYYLTRGFGGANAYRPLLPFTFAVDEAVGNGSPVPFHVTNTLLHSLNAYLLFSIAAAFGFRHGTALLAASAFLINPVVHESLLWISGRPVLLGSLFVLIGMRLFLLHHKAALAGTGLCLVLALGTYEIGVVLPFALGTICCLPRFRTRARIVTVLILLAICLAYILLWLKLFAFQITRFPVEHSVLEMLRCVLQSVMQSLHGSLRPVPGLVYMVLFLYCVRTKIGRTTALYLALFYILFYLPFLLVQGFADRFAYLSSTSAMLLVSYSVHEFRGKWPAILATALLVFFAVGMQNRVTTWKRAGEIARAIPAQIKSLAPDLAEGSTIVVAHVPLMYKQAYVFITGLQPAIKLAYGKDLDVKQAAQEGSKARVFAWTGERIVELPSR